jgi:hypothetical protein
MPGPKVMKIKISRILLALFRIKGQDEVVETILSMKDLATLNRTTRATGETESHYLCMAICEAITQQLNISVHPQNYELRLLDGD